MKFKEGFDKLFPHNKRNIWIQRAVDVRLQEAELTQSQHDEEEGERPEAGHG